MKKTISKIEKQKSWPTRVLAASVVVGLTVTIAQAATTTNRKPIGDLEIYSPAKPGTATIFMMLDTSGSMGDGFIVEDYGNSFRNCNANNINSETITAVVYNRKPDSTQPDGLLRDANGNTVKDLTSISSQTSFTPRGCTSGNTVRYSRLVRLQIALIELLADNIYKNNALRPTGSLSDDYEIGLGNYSYNGNGKTGVVLVPTKPLLANQRTDLIQKTKDLVAIGGTPTAHALSESGAYMMGTTTLSDVKVLAEREIRNNRNEWRRCNTNGNSSTLTFDPELSIYVYDCNNWGNWSTSSGSATSGILSGYNVDSNIDHTDGGRTYFAGDNSDSGYFNSAAVSKRGSNAPAGQENGYISPLNSKECSGNGIYILTDGEPNGTSTAKSKTIMNASLANAPTLSVNSCNGLSGGTSDGGWGCMADYAALLRNPLNNPLRLPIKTATVGFGKAFDGLTGKRTIILNNEPKEVVDCDSGPTSGSNKVSQDTRNLCKLGERKGDNEAKTFGDGGFYYTEESQDIANSIVDFASGLVQVINTAPSGTITIPEDPYLASNQLPYAYLPMLDPDINSAASIWKGNLKKYELNQGTLFGKSNRQLYRDIFNNANLNNSTGILDPRTQDLWQTEAFELNSAAANNNIFAGGVYSQLRTPSSGLSSVRSVYVEDFTSTNNKTPILRKLSVNSSGKPVGFNNLVDTAVYTQLNQRRLLSFLGFESVLTSGGQPTSTGTVTSLTLSKPTSEVKVLGGVVHSKPTTISYGATLDERGRITDNRNDYVLFGSMDGALHIVNADDGKEDAAIIPKFMLEAQPEALVNGSTKNKVGEPYFGVDAPWLVTTDYNYDLAGTAGADKRVTVDTATGKGMFAYGGLRMGGQAFYGMNISDRADPKIIFTITPDGLNYTASNDFKRLGQIWSKPTAAKVRLTRDAEPIDVLIFGGGYDMTSGEDGFGYENESYVPTSASPARGNAIYIINAKTGELIGSTSGEASGTKNTRTATMINSIVGEIAVLDRDNDGLVDHIYAGDLGGQVFRADFENARPAKFGFTAVDSFSIKRVTRVLNVAPSDGKLAYRFYERPVVSFYRNEGSSVNNGKLFALINVISGNRSAPLSTLRDNNTFANRIYGIIDNDVTSTMLYNNNFTPTVNNLTEANLVNLSTALGNTPTAAQKNTAKAGMVAGTTKGWYYPLTRFDGYTKVRYNKGVGDSAVINNLLYTTVYNPDKVYGTNTSCAAKISGGSERQLYCLPYGICSDATSINGTGGFIPAGQGIQELALGAFSKDSADVKVLIGTSTITDRILAENRTNYDTDIRKNSSNIKDLYPGENSRPTATGGDGSASEFLFSERYTLQPRLWYEQKPSS